MKNSNEHLKKIRRACIATNPEIGDLKEDRIEVRIEEFGSPYDAEDWANAFFGIKSIKIIPVHENKEHGHTSVWCLVEIILGRPIRLADVLLVLVKRNYDKPDTPITVWMRDQEHIVLKWKLLEDDLTKQSPETLEFISSLL